jgi:hypothetical protein
MFAFSLSVSGSDNSLPRANQIVELDFARAEHLN